jgi:NADPH-dependent curcumin reductase CurA
VIDHRSAGLPEKLAESCPSGIDVYFENVGGPIWQAVLPLLNRFARVPICGLMTLRPSPLKTIAWDGTISDGVFRGIFSSTVQ